MAHMNSGVSHSVFFSCDSWENSWWHGEDDLDSDAGSVHSETWCFLLIGWWDVGCGMWWPLFWRFFEWENDDTPMDFMDFYGTWFSDQTMTNPLSHCVEESGSSWKSQVEAPTNICLPVAVAVHFEGFGARHGSVL